MAIGRDCGEQAGFAAGLLAGTIGSSDALSERGIAALVRLRGKRRVGGARGALSVPTSPSAGSTLDPATAIRAVAGSGVDAFPDGIARSNTISPFAKSRLRHRVGGRAIWVSCERAGWDASALSLLAQLPSVQHLA